MNIQNAKNFIRQELILKICDLSFGSIPNYILPKHCHTSFIIGEQDLIVFHYIF